MPNQQEMIAMDRPSTDLTAANLPHVLLALADDCERDWVSKADIANALKNMAAALPGEKDKKK